MTRDKKGDKFHVQEYANVKGAHGLDTYELCAALSVIKDARMESEHIVAHVLGPSNHFRVLFRPRTTVSALVPPEYSMSRGGKTESTWHVFNDFTVLPISQYEAVHVNVAWKTPLLLFYRRVQSQLPVPSVTQPISDAVFFVENPLAEYVTLCSDSVIFITDSRKGRRRTW